MKELVVLLDNQEAGRIQRGRDGRVSLVYHEGWRINPAAYPISLSMPLAAAEHGHAKVDAFLWGLLPDNSRILESWANRFHVSARNAFGLLAAIGEDCAGAIQLVRPERMTAVHQASRGDVQWLDESKIAERLRALRANPSAWRMPADVGQFSLAGAQAKTALLFEEGRWGVPSGRLPTTHILKPPLPGFDGHVENEHFCLQLAKSLGLAVPKSKVMHFEDQAAIMVERYDRVRIENVLRRIHQEDLCQSLGLPPDKKYENDGGPGVRTIIDLLRTYSTNREEDVTAFINALAFNWLIAGTDAHAKNYGVLIGAQGVVRLAPLYDLGSALPYKNIDPLRVKLAMKIGGIYRLRYVGLRQWEKLISDCGLNAGKTIQRIYEMAASLPDYASEAKNQMTAAGLTHPLIDRLTQSLIARARRCASILMAA